LSPGANHMALTHSDVRKILETLDEAERFEYLEVSIGDFILRAAKTASALDRIPHAPVTRQVADSQSRAIETELLAPAPQPTSCQAEGGQAQGVESSREQLQDQPQQPDLAHNQVAVCSPMSGVFYRTPSPEEPPFVKEGGKVTRGDTVCLVEVMKLFNSVKAPGSGKVHRILVQHGELVELDQVLIILEVDASEAGT